LGGDLSLKAKLALGSPISDFVFSVGRRQLWLVDGLHGGEVHRWYGSIEYAPDSFPYVGIALKFSKGNNDDTLQQENTFSLGLNLRY
jgi:hypothetical protein